MVLFLFRRCCAINAKERDTLINEEINLPEVRLIGAEGEVLGMMSSAQALKIAENEGMDLVLMSAEAKPPVCKIMDYGKYCYDKDKRAKEAKKKQQVVELKEVQLSCRIDDHDFETKVRHGVRFLTDGNKVRVVVKFKGREMSHTTIGKEVIDKYVEACKEVGNIDKAPNMEGRFMSVVIFPINKK